MNISENIARLKELMGLITEQEDGFTPYKVGEVYTFTPSRINPELNFVEPIDAKNTFQLKVISHGNGILEVEKDGVKQIYDEKFNDFANGKQRYYCSKSKPSECIVDDYGGFTQEFKRESSRKISDFFSQGEHKTKIELTDENFDSVVYSSKKLFVVDFNAVWCVPCLRLGKFLFEIQKEMPDSFDIGSLDIDVEPKTRKKYQINAIPVLWFVKDGKILKKLDGVVPKEELEQIIKSLL